MRSIRSFGMDDIDQGQSHSNLSRYPCHQMFIFVNHIYDNISITCMLFVTLLISIRLRFYSPIVGNQGCQYVDLGYQSGVGVSQMSC